MRVVDLQMSVNGSIPAGAEASFAHAALSYRFFKDVDLARRMNLHRQESVIAPNPSTPSLLVQESIPSPARSYVNRARREPEGQKKENGQRPVTRYEAMGRQRIALPAGREIDFLA